MWEKRGSILKEFTILNIVNGGSPYYLRSFNSVDQAINAIYNIVSAYDNKRHMFYVDNDFFNNKYPLIFNNCHYIQLQEREVSEWVVYSKEKNLKKISNLY